jgi:hypothetical protein
MSKESKPADLWRQVFAAAADRPQTWCVGCGYFRVVNGVHRADCTAKIAAECQQCGAQLTRPDSIRCGLCLECVLTQDFDRATEPAGKENTVTDDDKAALRDELELLGLTAEEIEELVP